MKVIKEHRLDNIIDEVKEELQRAEVMHPNYPKDMFKQLAILQEEIGEVTKAVLHFNYENGSYSGIREELIQSTAMCLRMLLNLNKLK